MGATMARPRFPHSKLSRWGKYKRQQRDLPSKKGYVRHHVKPGTYGAPGHARTVLMSRSQHAAMHNALRKVRKPR